MEAYRDRAVAKFGSDFFSEENFYGAPLNVTSDRGWRSERLPIFWEFVQHVLDNRLIHRYVIAFRTMEISLITIN